MPTAATGTDQPAPILSSTEIVERIQGLSVGEKTALVKIARLYASEPLFGETDLLTETVSHALSDGFVWPRDGRAVNILWGTMRGATWDWRSRHSTDSTIAASATAEQRTAFLQEAVASLQEACGDDRLPPLALIAIAQAKDQADIFRLIEQSLRREGEVLADDRVNSEFVRVIGKIRRHFETRYGGPGADSHHRRPIAFDVADLLAANVLDTSASELTREAREDFGDANALAETCSTTLRRALPQRRWRRARDASTRLAARTVKLPAIAFGALAAIVVAAALYRGDLVAAFFRTGASDAKVLDLTEQAPKTESRPAQTSEPVLASAGAIGSGTTSVLWRPDAKQAVDERKQAAQEQQVTVAELERQAKGARSEHERTLIEERLEIERLDAKYAELQRQTNLVRARLAEERAALTAQTQSLSSDAEPTEQSDGVKLELAKAEAASAIAQAELTRLATMLSRGEQVPVWNAENGRMIAVLSGHANAVESAAFSPDGRRVATASDDHTARLWDSETGKEIAVLSGHEWLVRSAVFSPDGQRVITASWDKTTRIWDVESGKQLAVLSGHKLEVLGAVFSPDGRRVLTRSDDNTARIWEAQSGKEIATLKGHDGLVSAAHFSPDGKRVVTASFDKSLRIWNADNGQQIAVLNGHRAAVVDAAFSPDGQRVVSASNDATARIWDSTSGKMIAVLRGHDDAVISAAFSPDGQRVVTASFDKSARIWNADNGEAITVLRGHEQKVLSAAYGPGGRRIVTASIDGTARVWNADNGRPIAVLRGHQGAVKTAIFSADGRRVLTASEDKTARVWRAFVNRQPIAQGNGQEPNPSAATSQTGPTRQN
jgi:WD40 repeat protein